MKKAFLKRLATILFTSVFASMLVLTGNVGTMDVRAEDTHMVQLNLLNGATASLSNNVITVSATTGGTATITGGTITFTNSAYTVTEASLSISFTPASGYTPVVFYGGSNQTITSNQCTVGLLNSGNNINIIDIGFNAPGSGGGNNGGNTGGYNGEMRTVSMTIDPASTFLLAKDGFEMGFSSGDEGTQWYRGYTFNTTGTQSGEYPTNRDKVYMNCRVTDEYFIPSMVAEITYGDGTHETASDGTADMGGRNLAVDIPIRPGSDNVTIVLKLMIDKQVPVSSTSSSVSGGHIKYNITENGVTNIPDTASVGLSVADMADDATVAGTYGSQLLDTFDIGMTIDGSAQSQLAKPVEVSVVIDKTKIGSGTPVVVRNHNGTLTELRTMYNPYTGETTFETDAFSSYSIVVRETQTVANNDTSVSDPEEAAKEKIASLASFNLDGADSNSPYIYLVNSEQGPLAWNSINFAIDNMLGKGYKVFSTYNMKSEGELFADKKTGTLTLSIPSTLSEKSRNIAIIILRPDGWPMVYLDTDSNPETATFKIDTEGYAFAVCYLEGGESGSYVIQSGDTLSGIAAKLGVNMRDLAAMNGIADVNKIVAGRVLKY